jgi:polygalacturonase
MIANFPTTRRQCLALFATAAVVRAAGRKAAATSPKTAIKLNVRDFGAKADDETKDTAAFQQALDRCSVLGGGEVIVPAGNYRTGAVELRSNTLLRLEQGAVIFGTSDFADYPVTQVRWEGKWIQGHTGLLYAIGADHIGIVVLPGIRIWVAALMHRTHFVTPHSSKPSAAGIFASRVSPLSTASCGRSIPPTAKTS